MPAPGPSMTHADAERFVRDHCFTPAENRSGSGRVGVELEWLPMKAGADDDRATPNLMRGALALCEPLPCGGAVTFEPGGQVELSTLPAADVDEAIASVAADGALLDQALGRRGIRLVGLGFDPRNPPTRLLSSPRYNAMEHYFDQHGDAGRSMMCNSASIQVNVDLDGPAPIRDRWSLAHTLGPVLAAAFANSPFSQGGPSGYKSFRLATWERIDRSRSAPVLGTTPSGDPSLDYARYALSAQVMLIRSRRERFDPMLQDLSFGDWISRGHELGFPTIGDFEYHLTTLFPPVRARGRLELRVLDTQPGQRWRAAVALAVAMLDDGEAAERCTAAVTTDPTLELWETAARHGLDHPALARAASACFGAALDALPRRALDSVTCDAAADFVDRYIRRARCPADDLLDAWSRDEHLPPSAEPEWS